MNVFDIIGPVMVGPSSSHTAGAARIGKIVRDILGEEPVKAEILLHGSFAKTYKGHGTDKAIVAGLLGMAPEDERIRNSMELAKESGMEVSITTGIIKDAHPNTAEICAVGRDGKKLTVRGTSTGGGNIVINKINGMDVELTAQYNAIIISHSDAPGVIASITGIIAQGGINIANLKGYRSTKGGDSVMIIETDQEITPETEELIRKLPKIHNTALIKPI